MTTADRTTCGVAMPDPEAVTARVTEDQRNRAAVIDERAMAEAEYLARQEPTPMTVDKPREGTPR